MQSFSLLGYGALVASLGFLVFESAIAPASGNIDATAATLAAEPPATGHLVLVVEGTVRSLAVTRTLPKSDAWGGTPTGLQSRFALRLLDGAGVELLRLPLDLSRFDTDPANIGKPVRVTGCEVSDTRIGLLVSVPHLGGLQHIEFLRDEERIGSTPLAAAFPTAEAKR